MKTWYFHFRWLGRFRHATVFEQPRRSVSISERNRNIYSCFSLLFHKSSSQNVKLPQFLRKNSNSQCVHFLGTLPREDDSLFNVVFKAQDEIIQFIQMTLKHPSEIIFDFFVFVHWNQI